MSIWWHRVAVVVVVAAVACGPNADQSDVYPHNCGEVGPVDLFETNATAHLELARAGDHYLIEHADDAISFDYWAVDRCGESRVMLESIPVGPGSVAPRPIGVAGDFIVRCDDDTGAVQLLDPSGVAPPRPLFPSAHGCRLVPVAGGLAAQERDGTSVWFHPAPHDPTEDLVLLTDRALPPDRYRRRCAGIHLDCDEPREYPAGTQIQAAGDDLLVAFGDGPRFVLSDQTIPGDNYDRGLSYSMDVLPDERYVVLIFPDAVFDRQSGGFIGSWSGSHPIRAVGQWLLQGYMRQSSHEGKRWISLSARHLPTGSDARVWDVDDWIPVAGLDDAAVVVDTRPQAGAEFRRHVAWPATGERRPVDLPGSTLWNVVGQDGVYAYDSGDVPDVLRHLARPDQTPREVLRGAWIAYPTTSDRIVFTRRPAQSDVSVLSVMLPGGAVEELDFDASQVFDSDRPFVNWPLSLDEVVYTVQRDGRSIVRRTVLP